MESLRRKLNENCAYYIVNDERLDKNENLVQEVKIVEYRGVARKTVREGERERKRERD